MPKELKKKKKLSQLTISNKKLLKSVDVSFFWVIDQLCTTMFTDCEVLNSLFTLSYILTLHLLCNDLLNKLFFKLNK